MACKTRGLRGPLDGWKLVHLRRRQPRRSRRLRLRAILPGHQHQPSLGPELRVFPGNTLDRYGTDTGIDSDLAIRQAGRWDFAPDVAIFAFGDTVLQEPDQSMWPTLICTDPSVLEIVTAGPIEFTDVLEVRISRSDRRRFNKLSVLDREGQLTDEAEREVVAAWQIVQEWINESHPEILLRIV